MDFNSGGAVKGAAGGAMTGAAIGSVVPGAGTAAGAIGGGIVGGLLGGFGGSGGPSRPDYTVYGGRGQYDTYGRLAGNFGQRRAPQVNWQGNSFRNYQSNLARMLLAESQGRGVGQQVVRQQAQQMGDRALMQALAASQGQPGGGAMAARNAAFAGAGAQSQVGGQAALAGGQLALGAQGQLGGLAGQARGQDLGAQFGNAGLEMQTRQQNDQALLEALRQRQQLSGLMLQGSMGYGAANQAANPGLGNQLLGMGVGASQLGMMGGGGGGGQTGPGYYNPNIGQGYRYGG